MTVFAKRMGSSFETISRFAAPGEPKFPGKKLLLVQHRFHKGKRGEPGPCRTQASGLLSFERRQPGFPNKAARKRETI